MMKGMTYWEILPSSWSTTHQGGGCLASLVSMCAERPGLQRGTSLHFLTTFLPCLCSAGVLLSRAELGPHLCSPFEEMAFLGAPHALCGVYEYDAHHGWAFAALWP